MLVEKRVLALADLREELEKLHATIALTILVVLLAMATVLKLPNTVA
jgi:hypothetical protein